MSRNLRPTDLIDRMFRQLERCWPGVIGGLVAGFLVASVGGSILGGLAAIAGTVGATWLHATRGRRRRVMAVPEFIRQSASALAIVGVVFTAYVFLSWAKWLIALGAVGLLAWSFHRK